MGSLEGAVELEGSEPDSLGSTVSKAELLVVVDEVRVDFRRHFDLARTRDLDALEGNVIIDPRYAFPNLGITHERDLVGFDWPCGDCLAEDVLVDSGVNVDPHEVREDRGIDGGLTDLCLVDGEDERDLSMGADEVLLLGKVGGLRAREVRLVEDVSELLDGGVVGDLSEELSCLFEVVDGARLENRLVQDVALALLVAAILQGIH